MNQCANAVVRIKWVFMTDTVLQCAFFVLHLSGCGIRVILASRPESGDSLSAKIGAFFL